MAMSEGGQCLYDKIKLGVDEVIQQFKEANVDGKVDFMEAMGILTLGMGHVIKLVGSIVGYTNEERRECMLKCAERFVDEVLVPWDIPSVPDWIEGPADRIMRTAILGFIPSVIDSLVRLLDTVDDWIPSPGPAPVPDIDDGRIIGFCKLPPEDLVKGCCPDGGNCCEGQ